MNDRSGLQAKLDSTMFGALAHITESFMDSVQAHVSICRLLDPIDGPNHTYVSTPCPAVTHTQRRALLDWPQAEDSPFAYYQHHPPQQTVWLLTPRDSFASQNFDLFFRRFDELCGVTTAMCLMMSVHEQTRCLLVLMRCGEHEPFTDQHVDMIQRTMPVASRVLQRAYLTEAAGSSPMADLLKRLSPTEQKVLGLLCKRETERQIAQTVGRSPHTIHVHVKSIYRKLMVTSRRQLLEVLDQNEHANGLSALPASNQRVSPGHT